MGRLLPVLHGLATTDSPATPCCVAPPPRCPPQVLAARQMGKWVVTPAWLECSCILWKRAHEERFLVPL